MSQDIVRLCRAVGLACKLREASYLSQSDKYTKSWWDCGVEAATAFDCPEEELQLIYFLAISGEGADYAEGYLKAKGCVA